MLTRPLLAICTALCLLVSLIAVPGGPKLVCQITGEPMVLVVKAATETHGGSCCEGAAKVEADGTVGYALTDPGCCKLSQSTGHSEPPALTVPTVELPAMALVSPRAATPLPLLVEAPLSVTAPRESAPRAPPQLSSASPRAPPCFA